eukprot:Gb_29154 [translate_table: standard]
MGITSYLSGFKITWFEASINPYAMMCKQGCGAFACGLRGMASSLADNQMFERIVAHIESSLGEPKGPSWHSALKSPILVFLFFIFHKKIVVRRERVKLFGAIATVHGDVVTPHLTKIIASIVKCLKDPDSIVRDACQETMGVLAAHYVCANATSGDNVGKTGLVMIWTTRKVATDTMSQMATHLNHALMRCKSSTVLILEACRFDKGNQNCLKVIASFCFAMEIHQLKRCLLSTIDPVVVVALLKDLGASKNLSTTMKGESLMNDGVALGAVALGLAFGLESDLWIGIIFNDTVLEISLTLTVSYVAYKFLYMDLGSLGIWSGIHQRQDYLEGLAGKISYSGRGAYT